MNSLPNGIACMRGIAGSITALKLHHQPWSLQPASAEIRANSMAEPFGLTLPAKPEVCHFSRSLKMLVWAPEVIRLAR